MSKIETVIYERPELENPVYKVTIGSTEKFIQRQLGMNPGDTAWYEVEKINGYWETKGGSGAGLCNQIGFTKQEAIEELERSI